MYASIWFMSGVAVHLFLLTKLVSASTSQVNFDFAKNVLVFV